MKQIVQYFSDGKTLLLEVPVPNIKDNQILIKTKMSLISSGTEKMLIDFGKGNIIQKAKQQPEKVKMVIQKAKNDGIVSTIEAVRNKIDQPITLGYCNVGEVIKVGKKIKEFKVGDRVVSNGPHSEYVAVTENLAALIPDEVSNEDAVFTVLASIGLNGIRLAKPTFGETFVVSGLGIIGILTCQLLKANGCNVIGIDPDNKKCELAKSLKINSLNLSNDIDTVDLCININNNFKVDGVIITATTKSNEPIETAAKLCRKRGRIILVGQTGLELNRDDFYKKEITFQVSCSYGPGRYDENYEKKGNDYPIGFVRWTENRNFQAILKAFSSKKISGSELISHKFEFNNALSAYNLLSENKYTMGIILNYENKNYQENNKTILLKDQEKSVPANTKNISFIGAGNYASSKLIPAFKKAGANFHGISSNTGLNSTYLAQKYKFKFVTTNIQEILNDDLVKNIIISTRHDSHAELIIKSLKKGKNIFVEKPLCLNREQFNKIKEIKLENQILMVGFNRRFSPLTKKLKNELNKLNSPKSFIYTINAEKIPKDHWLNDPNIGGGRLIGEGCHFVDLLRFLASSKIKTFKVDNINGEQLVSETFIVNITFEDGSIGTINYFSNGNKNFPKERLEVFCSGYIFQLNNFRELNIINSFKKNIKRIGKQDKGQDLCAEAFLIATKENSSSPIPIDEILEVQDNLLKGVNL